MDNVTVMIALIWYIVRDYHANTYPLKAVQNAAIEWLTKAGHNASVFPGKRGIIQVDGETYKIYRIRNWGSYDVRHIIL